MLCCKTRLLMETSATATSSQGLRVTIHGIVNAYEWYRRRRVLRIHELHRHRRYAPGRVQRLQRSWLINMLHTRAYPSKHARTPRARHRHRSDGARVRAHVSCANQQIHNRGRDARDSRAHRDALHAGGGRAAIRGTGRKFKEQTAAASRYTRHSGAARKVPDHPDSQIQRLERRVHSR
ncbi:hypothetical protein PsYK624_165310 [Phanerochaete sordida]|uniref:Uncharacterized protein n=1 Tax=Phanerochaete sordida TaxID=48140 RepID=A0A9P3GR07_9APHY|nr:hypothetical protein PsYK624_165310 [Phanerochaete sordida]